MSHYWVAMETLLESFWLAIVAVAVLLRTFEPWRLLSREASHNEKE